VQNHNNDECHRKSSDAIVILVCVSRLSVLIARKLCIFVFFARVLVYFITFLFVMFATFCVYFVYDFYTNSNNNK